MVPRKASGPRRRCRGHVASTKPTICDADLLAVRAARAPSASAAVAGADEQQPLARARPGAPPRQTPRRQPITAGDRHRGRRREHAARDDQRGKQRVERRQDQQRDAERLQHADEQLGAAAAGVRIVVEVAVVQAQLADRGDDQRLGQRVGDDQRPRLRRRRRNARWPTTAPRISARLRHDQRRRPPVRRLNQSFSHGVATSVDVAVSSRRRSIRNSRPRCGRARDRSRS